MAEKLDDNGWPVKPRRLHEDAWFYEGKRGITVAFVARGTLQSITGIVEIPWSRLKSGMDRHRRLKAKRSR